MAIFPAFSGLVTSALGDLLTRLFDAAQAAGLFVGILLAVYLPGRLLVVPALKRLEPVVPISETEYRFAASPESQPVVITPVVLRPTRARGSYSTRRKRHTNWRSYRARQRK